MVFDFQIYFSLALRESLLCLLLGQRQLLVLAGALILQAHLFSFSDLHQFLLVDGRAHQVIWQFFFGKIFRAESHACSVKLHGGGRLVNWVHYLFARERANDGEWCVGKARNLLVGLELGGLFEQVVLAGVESGLVSGSGPGLGGILHNMRYP